MKEGTTPKNKSAPYSPTTKPEINAINLLNYILDTQYCIPHITQGDKTPNIDGTIDIIDEKCSITGKIEVQVKKMPNRYTPRPRHDFPIGLIDYAKNSTNNPVIFISVDCVNSIAYWQEVSTSRLSDYSKKIAHNIEKFILHFPAENVIDSDSSDYINAWQEIFRKKNSKYRDNEDLQKQNKELRERSNPLLGETRPEFGNLHSFIDEINQIIELKFSIIKRNLFDNCWKLGISYRNYSDKQVTYGLYPIPSAKNDLQIIQLPDDFMNKPVLEEISTIHSYISNNPLHTQPKLQAVNDVKGYVEDILKYHLLTHAGNDFLAREYLFALVDSMSISLGVEEKNQYRVDELKQGFYVHLPFWLDEASQYIRRNSSKYPTRLLLDQRYVDPILIIPYIDPETQILIEQNIQRRIKNGEAIPRVPTGNEKIQMGIVNEFLNYLSTDPSREIRRVYPKRKLERTSCGSEWKWDSYTKEEFKKDMEIFFENLPSVYDFVLAQNFHEIADDLSSLKGISKFVFFYGFSGKIPPHKIPSYEYFYLRGDEGLGLPEVHVLPMEEKGSFSELSPRNRDVVIDGKVYQIREGGCKVCFFLFEETPMMNFIYQLLESDLRRYWKKLTY